MEALEYILYGIYARPNINTRDARLKIRDHISLAQSEWKGVELSVKIIGKGLHKVFKGVLKYLNNSLPALR